MSSEIRARRQLELPPRRSRPSYARISELAADFGGDPSATARLHAEAELREGLAWIALQRKRALIGGKDEARLIADLEARNLRHWGEFAARAGA